jgi:hypothetical protein
MRFRLTSQFRQQLLGALARWVRAWADRTLERVKGEEARVERNAHSPQVGRTGEVVGGEPFASDAANEQDPRSSDQAASVAPMARVPPDDWVKRVRQGAPHLLRPRATVHQHPGKGLVSSRAETPPPPASARPQPHSLGLGGGQKLPAAVDEGAVAPPPPKPLGPVDDLRTERIPSPSRPPATQAQALGPRGDTSVPFDPGHGTLIPTPTANRAGERLPADQGLAAPERMRTATDHQSPVAAKPHVGEMRWPPPRGTRGFRVESAGNAPIPEPALSPPRIGPEELRLPRDVAREQEVQEEGGAAVAVRDRETFPPDGPIRVPPVIDGRHSYESSGRPRGWTRGWTRGAFSRTSAEACERGGAESNVRVGSIERARIGEEAAVKVDERTDSRWPTLPAAPIGTSEALVDPWPSLPPSEAASPSDQLSDVLRRLERVRRLDLEQEGTWSA